MCAKYHVRARIMHMTRVFITHATSSLWKGLYFMNILKNLSVFAKISRQTTAYHAWPDAARDQNLQIISLKFSQVFNVFQQSKFSGRPWKIYKNLHSETLSEVQVLRNWVHYIIANFILRAFERFISTESSEFIFEWEIPLLFFHCITLLQFETARFSVRFE